MLNTYSPYSHTVSRAPEELKYDLEQDIYAILADPSRHSFTYAATHQDWISFMDMVSRNKQLQLSNISRKNNV